MSATIYDVASRASVSIATVSRALNAPHTVNGATLQRIQDAIEVLGFVPKAEATARARRSHRQIGVLAPFFSHYPSFMQRMRGIAAALQDTTYEFGCAPAFREWARRFSVSAACFGSFP